MFFGYLPLHRAIVREKRTLYMTRHTGQEVYTGCTDKGDAICIPPFENGRGMKNLNKIMNTISLPTSLVQSGLNILFYQTVFFIENSELVLLDPCDGKNGDMTKINMARPYK